MHTNTVEEIFQDLRHWLNTFRGICKKEKNLRLFVSMFQFNHNHRDLSQTDKFTELLRTIIRTP